MAVLRRYTSLLRVQLATPSLPPEVTRQGVIVNKQSNSILAIVAMSSPGSRYDSIYISNYALLNVVDELKRTPGVQPARQSRQPVLRFAARPLSA